MGPGTGQQDRCKEEGEEKQARLIWEPQQVPLLCLR